MILEIKSKIIQITKLTVTPSNNIPEEEKNNDENNTGEDEAPRDENEQTNKINKDTVAITFAMQQIQ